MCLYHPAIKFKSVIWKMSEQYKRMLKLQVHVGEEAVANDDKKGSKHFKTLL